MFYVMYKERLDSMFFKLKEAEKYINHQKDYFNYKIVKKEI